MIKEIQKEIQNEIIKIEIFLDDFPLNPRKNGNLGKILYVSSRYNLGDERVTPETIKEISLRKDIIMLPVYAYVHSLITLKTTPFGCKWDSGLSGIIYCTREEARTIYPHLGDEELEEKIREELQLEIKEFSSYLSGEVYGYVITNSNELVNESCWDFFSVEEAENAAMEILKTIEIPKSCTTIPVFTNKICENGNIPLKGKA